MGFRGGDLTIRKQGGKGFGERGRGPKRTHGIRDAQMPDTTRESTPVAPETIGKEDNRF